MSIGLVTNNVIARTTTKTVALANRIANRKCQLTELRSSVAMDMKINEGNANVPTNVFNPLASVTEMMFNLPATYLCMEKLEWMTNCGLVKKLFIPAKNNSKALNQSRIQVFKGNIFSRRAFRRRHNRGGHIRSVTVYGNSQTNATHILQLLHNIWFRFLF